MSDKNLIMWIILIAGAVFFTYWQFRENKMLFRQLRKDLDNTSARWLERFTRTRSIQLLCVMGIAVVIIISYDWQLSEARQQLAQLAQAKQTPSAQLPVATADEQPVLQESDQQAGLPPVPIPAGGMVAQPRAVPHPAAAPATPPAPAETGPNAIIANPYAPAGGKSHMLPSGTVAPGTATSPAPPVASQVAPSVAPAAQAVANGAGLNVTNPVPLAVPNSPQTVPVSPQTPAPAVAAPASNVVAPPPTGMGNAALPSVQVATPVTGVTAPSLPQQAPNPAVQPGQEATANAAGETVEDVYNPEAKSKDKQSAMDDMKKRYEDVLVLYFFLQKCGHTTPDEYRTIISSLAQEMAYVNAPGRMQYDIITAAQGAYKELYSKSSCDADVVNGLSTQYQDFIHALSQNIPG